MQKIAQLYSEKVKSECEIYIAQLIDEGAIQEAHFFELISIKI